MLLDNDHWPIQLVMNNIPRSWFEFKVILRKVHDALSVNGKWMPPSPGIVKLNVDGNGNDCTRHSDCGGLLRANAGEWLLGFSSRVQYVDITLVELIALKQGLMLAWDRGYRELICKTGCYEVFHLVQFPRISCSYVLDSLLLEIQLMPHQW